MPASKPAGWDTAGFDDSTWTPLPSLARQTTRPRTNTTYPPIPASHPHFQYKATPRSDGVRPGPELHRLAPLHCHPPPWCSALGPPTNPMAILAHPASTLNRCSSENDFMLGDGEEWFYRGLAGIDVDLSGAPAIAASATLDTPLGTIRCAWSKTGDRATEGEVTAPPNATATLLLPAPYRAWKESGLPLARATGVTSGSDQRVIRLESGNYRLAATR